MKRSYWIALMFLTASVLPIGNGLRYLFDGSVYQNSDLRNYAVVGQILFGLTTMIYGYRLYKTSFKNTEQ